jgi:hypothetical protein
MSAAWLGPEAGSGRCCGAGQRRTGDGRHPAQLLGCGMGPGTAICCPVLASAGLEHGWALDAEVEAAARAAQRRQQQGG